MSHLFLRRVRTNLFTKLRPDRSLPTRAVGLSFRQVHDQHSNDYKRRIAQLEQYALKEEWYPRIGSSQTSVRCPIQHFNEQYDQLEKGEIREEVSTVVTGRVKSVRTAGSKLIFVTIEQDQHDLQIVLRRTDSADSLQLDDLSRFHSIARKGDSFSFYGHPHRTQRGQLSLLATQSPILRSPSLHLVPEVVSDPELLAHNRHLRMLVDPDALRVIKIRHQVERTIRDFLHSRSFEAVSTPIIHTDAGGAIARPFKTQANELHDKTLHLRIAPELWLKRLILGGMDRVYEIGPVFRNEGVDATHNPEFTICEFYAAHTTLQELIIWTEQLMSQLSTSIGHHDIRVNAPFAQLEFLPTIEDKLGQTLPDLDTPDVEEQLTAIFVANNIHLPAKPSLPRLLDALCAHYIEPECVQPTFITHHPAALSPLAKHMTCPATQQRISARAELFVAGKEVANMYEEQNSPFAQEQAFVQQLKYRAIDGEDDGSGTIDRAYLEALEWGLPPSGGWGCGVDRLVMLFSGKDKIADVLPFGTLRHVVGSGGR